MEEFLLSNYMTFTLSFEFLAAITGLFCLRKYKNTPVKYFIYFLCFIAISEFLSLYTLFVENGSFLWFLKGTIFERNYWLVTMYWTIGSIIFYSFYYLKVIRAKKYLNILKFSSFAYLTFVLLYISTHFNAYFYKSFASIDIAGTVIIFICVFFYFLELLQSNKILKFHKSINFYISSVILIWWLIITPLVFYQSYFNNVDWNFIFLRWQIYLFANIFMYSTFTFALIWCEPEND